MTTQPHKDGFVLLHSDLTDQLAYAPDEALEGEGPEAWARAYHLVDTHAEAREDADDNAWGAFAAGERGDIADRYQTMGDVPRDLIRRARVFEDGLIRIYGCDPEHGEAPEIGEAETPEHEFTAERAYGAFGMSPPDNASRPGGWS